MEMSNGINRMSHEIMGKNVIIRNIVVFIFFLLKITIFAVFVVND